MNASWLHVALVIRSICQHVWARGGSVVFSKHGRSRTTALWVHFASSICLNSLVIVPLECFSQSSCRTYHIRRLVRVVRSILSLFVFSRINMMYATSSFHGRSLGLVLPLAHVSILVSRHLLVRRLHCRHRLHWLLIHRLRWLLYGKQQLSV